MGEKQESLNFDRNYDFKNFIGSFEKVDFQNLLKSLNFDRNYDSILKIRFVGSFEKMNFQNLLKS